MKDQTRQKDKLDGLKKDLASVKKDADAAQGITPFLPCPLFSDYISVCRGAEEGIKE